MSNHAETETLVRTLAAVADQVEASDDWDLLVADIEERDADVTPLGRSTYRPRLLTAAAVLLVLVASWGVFADFGDDGSGSTEISTTRPNFVLPGEMVLADNPLIVAAAPGPVPDFDTSGLGRQIIWEPVLELTDEISTAIARRTEREMMGSTDRTVAKITVLGQTDGDLWLIIVTDGPNMDGVGGAAPEDNLRLRSTTSPSGSAGSGNLVPVDSLEMIEQPLPEATGPSNSPGLAYSVPTGWVTVSGLPWNAAAVSFADSDQQLWMIPVEGTAGFLGQFDDGESFTIEAFNAQGQLVSSTTETIRYADDAQATNPQTGDSFGTLVGTNSSGEPTLIEPNGSPTILVYGAQWCVPCSRVIEQALPALEQLGDTVNVYSVPHYVEGDEAWPIDPEWPYPTLHPGDRSPITAVGSVPTVLVLDGEHRVLGLIQGFDDLAGELQKLGIEPP